MHDYTKPALSVDEQLERLEDRGLTIGEADAAKAWLTNVNYYRMSAYWRVDRLQNRQFRNGATFEDALRRYRFDRHLRLVCLDGIEQVEVMFRARMANTLALQGGRFIHEDPNSRQKRRRGDDLTRWIDRLHSETRRSKELFVDHFRNKYNGFPTLPVYVASEVMSFGSLSRLYKDLDTGYRKVLAQPFGLPHQVLESWLHALVYARNVAAHHGRLWNRKLAIKPKSPRNRRSWSGGHVPRNDRVFAVLCVLRELTRELVHGEVWAQAAADWVERLCERAEEARMAGIPEKWAESPLWRDVATSADQRE